MLSLRHTITQTRRMPIVFFPDLEDSKNLVLFSLRGEARCECACGGKMNLIGQLLPRLRAVPSSLYTLAKKKGRAFLFHFV